jgi:hypothetical protein
VLARLDEKELNDSYGNLSFLYIEFLITAQFGNFVVLVVLPGHLLDNLSEHELQLDSTHPV